MPTLIAARNSEHLASYNWKMLLRLAGQYGWKPKGITPVKITCDCNGIDIAPEEQCLCKACRQEMEQYPAIRDYVTCDGGVVSAADARKLAAALKKALPDIPDHDARAGKVTTDPFNPLVRYINTA